MNTLRITARWLRRDWRSGELRTLMAALAIAVAAITAVQFFTDRVLLALQYRGAELLASDLAYEHGKRLPQALEDEARRRGLHTARILSFPSVVFHNDRPVLTQIKVVGPGYPLRGELRISSGIGEPGSPRLTPPGADEVWLEPRLAGMLGLKLGDRLELGRTRFKVTGFVAYEPDRGGNLFQFAPRLMLGLDAIEATGLLGPASRVKHRLLIAGDPATVRGYARWASGRLPIGSNRYTLSNARPELRSALDRGTRFLSLAALCASLLAGAAVAVATRRFVHRQIDAAALLRSLGASSRMVALLFSLRVLVLGVGASVLGALLGLVAQSLLAGLIGDWFGSDLPPAGLGPALSGLLIGSALLVGFALPDLLRFAQVSPLRVLRHDLPAPSLSAWITRGIAVGVMVLLVFWQAGDAKLGFTIAAGVGATLLLLFGFARLLMFAVQPLRKAGRTSLRQGLAALARRRSLTALQIAGFGLGVMVVLLLAIVRVDLLNAWQQNLPTGTPNQFALNIQPDEVDAYRAALRREGIEHSGLYPMIRGRLIAINDRPVRPAEYKTMRARRLAAREFNLSIGPDMQADNRTVAGRWWSKEELDRPWVSVERGIAHRLGMKLGDRIRFDIAGEQVEGRVVHLRKVQWDSFNVNFFVQGTPGWLKDQPATWITSFYLPENRYEVLTRLNKEFPAVSVIDVGAVLRQVREIIAQGSLAVEAVFAFTLAAGLMVMVAAVQLSRDARLQEIAILRTFGASRGRVMLAALAEFGTMGALAGFLAAAGASAIGGVVAVEIFNLGWRPNPWPWVFGPLGGALVMGAAGLLAIRPLLGQSPSELLRERFQ